MNKTKMTKLASELTLIQNTKGFFLPLQLVRLDQKDFMLIVQTNNALTQENHDKLKELAQKHEVEEFTRAGTYFSYR